MQRAEAGKHFVRFLPAVSDEALKAMSRELRSWRLNCRSDKSLNDFASMFNKVVQGWINYYGRFYPVATLNPLLRRINAYLVRWATRKYKRLRGHPKREPDNGWCASRNANLPCSLTGGSCGPTAGQWELSESRGSCSVLGEPEGATPSGHSPAGLGCGHRRTLTRFSRSPDRERRGPLFPALGVGLSAGSSCARPPHAWVVGVGSQPADTAAP